MNKKKQQNKLNVEARLNISTRPLFGAFKHDHRIQMKNDLTKDLSECNGCNDFPLLNKKNN